MRETYHRKIFATVVLLSFLCPVYALDIINRYSPRNVERPLRPNTRFIILHTTEGPTRGSLNKVCENGEAHFFVEPGGKVYRVIDRRRVAFHAGRSMWDRLTDLDNHSIGVEVVGYHNKDITPAQYKALKELIIELQRIYMVPDERVLTHSMIAYGAPNRWHKHSHRGRKRCGMLFARRSVRLKLGLEKQPLFDPDVKAGRLVDADPYLAKVLYGTAKEQEVAAKHFTGSDANIISAQRSAWDIARDKYRSSETLYVFPDGTKHRGNEITDWKKMPVGTTVVLAEDQRENENENEGVKILGRDAETAREIAGDEYNADTTIYFLPDGTMKFGNKINDSEWEKLPAGTRMLVGYVYGGKISSRKTAFDLCGERWNFPSTVYRFVDGSFKSGDNINERLLPANTLVFYSN